MRAYLIHLRFRKVAGQQLLTKWSERDLSLMNVQVFLCGGGSSFDSFAHGSLSLWLWQLVPKIWTNFFLLQLLTTFGTRRRFLKRFASVVRYQCIFYPSSTAHQLMVVQSITILKVFRWLTTDVRRMLCFFSWCHHFLATTPPAYVGNSPAIAPLTRTMIISCRLTQMVFWEGWQQRWEDFFDPSRRWKKRGKRRVMWRLLDPLRDCRDFSGFLLFGGCSVENLRFNPGGKLRLIGSN